ncbi:cupredoxin family copper-binding protein [Chromobacterium sp. IIBBL 290-4]|uniref:cupredoxin domain-containing protein n=1 Tax=Chromobacterium sp. IIBBL 290-4 TaxID=2953890 RepID=UPI0020B75D89|nr:cupredoxin family copper-binding protein [Chromobacterium sp. IIBBL 290-4]UTH72609.1 cupredoxin family copper-binding protein [Chromobacterium sp. IIBBL 290-4]
MLKAACWMAGALLMAALSAQGADGGHTVAISKFAFQPKELTVAPGAKVVWVNQDETPHTVTSRSKAFASKALDTDDKFEHVFEAEGDYPYYCVVHPFMGGVIHVRKP